MLEIAQRRPSRSSSSANDGGEQVKRAPAVPKFGVALFDNPKEMTVGWACCANEEPFRFSSANELSNDAIWVTSLDWNKYQMRGQRLSHLRRVDYLRSSLSQIAADLGRRITGEYARESSAVLAKVVQQAVMIAVGVYGWEEPSSDLREDVLADDIQRTVGTAPKPQRHIRAPLLSAYQAYSSPPWDPIYEADSVTVTLRYNRLEYARQIMATAVPDDAWTYVPPNQAQILTIDSLLDPSRPSLVEAAVELGNINPSTAALIAFGAQVSRRSGLRKWISQPELVWLSRHARVRVTSALISRSARLLPDTAQLPQRMLDDPLFSLSISAGLVAESHWSAITSPVYNRQDRKNEASSWGVWLRAADRALSFGLAMKAHEAGFHVVGYGNGSVVLRLTRPRLEGCLEFADQNGIAHPAFHPIFQEHGIRRHAV
jgi:hypothetical protein